MSGRWPVDNNSVLLSVASFAKDGLLLLFRKPLMPRKDFLLSLATMLCVSWESLFRC